MPRVIGDAVRTNAGRQRGEEKDSKMQNSETDILARTNDLSAESAQTLSRLVDEQIKKKEKIKAIVFLTGITGVSVVIGFGSTLAAVRKTDPKSFNEGIVGAKGITETGGQLALRALGWGTFYACTGCSLLFYGIWKFSGATSMQDFRTKMGNLLPRIPKNNPPQSRTEFTNLTDLMKYVSEDYGKTKTPKTND